MNPLVSVVIPTYNRARDLKHALQSVIDQSYAEWEALIVDNHSTDETQRVVEAFGDRRMRLFSVHNHGVIAVSRNHGLRHARGTYVAFLDSDDWWCARKLERSLQQLEAGADLVYHDLYVARPHNKHSRFRRVATRTLASPVREDLLAHGNGLANSSVVVRRELLLRVGGLSEDPGLVSWEDFDCWLRLAALTERFRRIPEPLGYYSLGPANMTSPQRNLRNLELIRDLYLWPRAGGRERELPAWYHYGTGRAHYRLRNYRLARWHLAQALGGQLSASVRVRAMMTLCQSLLRAVVPRSLGGGTSA